MPGQVGNDHFSVTEARVAWRSLLFCACNLYQASGGGLGDFKHIPRILGEFWKHLCHSFELEFLKLVCDELSR